MANALSASVGRVNIVLRSTNDINLEAVHFKAPFVKVAALSLESKPVRVCKVESGSVRGFLLVNGRVNGQVFLEVLMEDSIKIVGLLVLVSLEDMIPLWGEQLSSLATSHCHWGPIPPQRGLQNSASGCLEAGNGAWIEE